MRIGGLFAASSDKIQAFPAKLEHVALHLQHVLDTIMSYPGKGLEGSL